MLLEQRARRASRAFARVRAGGEQRTVPRPRGRWNFGRVRDGTLVGAPARFSRCETVPARQREGPAAGGRLSVIVGIDGTPALRRFATGTEIYARSIIDALAAVRGTRTMRVYANAVEAPPWLPAGVEWRGIPFPRLWTHGRLRQALRRERPDVTFIPSHVLPVALGLKSVVTIHDLGHRREPRSYSRAAWWYLEAMTRYLSLIHI